MKEAISKYKPTLKPLLLALLLLLSVWCSAQALLPIVRITNGSVFARQSAINYSVLCPQSCYYYIGIETLLDGQWREIMLDVSLKAPSKAAVLKKAMAKKKTYGQFPVPNIPAAYLHHKSIFRLKLTYGISPATVNKVVLSQKFAIE
jgi:hypothetical protein